MIKKVQVFSFLIRCEIKERFVTFEIVHSKSGIRVQLGLYCLFWSEHGLIASISNGDSFEMLNVS